MVGFVALFSEFSSNGPIVIRIKYTKNKLIGDHYGIKSIKKNKSELIHFILILLGIEQMQDALNQKKYLEKSISFHYGRKINEFPNNIIISKILIIANAACYPSIEIPDRNCNWLIMG